VAELTVPVYTLRPLLPESNRGLTLTQWSPLNLKGISNLLLSAVVSESFTVFESSRAFLLVCLCGHEPFCGLCSPT
jgi:hypothetical protein